ncbi:hypothetical protein HDV06_006953 [Boothiomyces sp. JEL0866]|nr:hypothetical protein HDV06_006953 [Boothiomyces sp. JEL0866]
MAQLVIQTGWFENYYCQGAPDSIIVFNETNPTPVCNMTMQNYDWIPSCGSDSYNVPIGCCFSSLDLSFTYGYHSFSRNYLSDYSFDQSVPSGIANYCQLSTLNNQLYNGYQEMYIRQTGGCVEDYFACNQTHLQIYGNQSCFGLTNEIPLSAAGIETRSDLLGGIFVNLFVSDHGNMDVMWTSFVPPMLMIPNYSEPLEIVMLISYIFAITVYALFFSVQVYRIVKLRNKKYLLQFLVSTFWACRLSMLIYYTYTIFEDFELLSTFTFALILADTGTLFSTIISSFMLFDIFKVSSTWKKVLVITVLTLVHLFCEIPSYVYWSPWIKLEVDISGFAMYTRSAWKFIAICTDLIPVALIFGMIIKAARIKSIKSDAEEHVASINYTWKLIAIISLQFITGVLYILFFNTDDIIGKSDRQMNAIDGINTSILLIHEILLMVMYQSLQDVTRVLVSPHTVKQKSSERLVHLVAKQSKSPIHSVQTVVDKDTVLTK